MNPVDDLMPPLQRAQDFAKAGRFEEMLKVCRQIINNNGDSINILLDVGTLLSNFGFLSDAHECYERACILSPDDLRGVGNLANLARDAGNHTESRTLYKTLRDRLPNHPVIRRNSLLSLEYDPEVSDLDRLAEAKAWGAWAVKQSGGIRPRPEILPLAGRPLRLGYLSADFCQHTVGLFVMEVLKSLNHERITAFTYSAGQVKDWVTDAISICSNFRDISLLDDTALAKQIRSDSIDILIDLSGHTAGSRLSVFAHRPAPVQLSWLGYFASTGLSCMDAVLLDQWHVSSTGEAQFVEPVVRLPMGRFCYTPVPFAPPVSPAPTLAKGYITFGCFNNTSKLNDAVFDVWAAILCQIPESRLILKWRTFNDSALGDKVKDAFNSRGVAVDRLELRGPSFHVDLLKEYADIDIALDPFPFTGGLTSCEALWMGVPVVTWPQSRVVSRQTFAFLSAIGLAELAARDADDYVRIAVEMAGDCGRLLTLRKQMREKMQNSPLMDVPGFASGFEQCLIELYQEIYTREKNYPMNSKTVLHVGAGHKQNGAKLPPFFQTPEWRELRLDIDPVNEPDIIGTMLDMAAVESGSVDALYSAHNIEHVYAHEVPVVLKEFFRVLRHDGFLVITCPDLQSICALVAEDKLRDPAYQSPAGPITPLDILYGHGEALAHGHFFMAHKCGFTLKTLTQSLQEAGFQSIAGKRRVKGLDLWLLAVKEQMTEKQIRELAGRILPG